VITKITPPDEAASFGDSHEQMLTAGDRLPTTFSEMQRQNPSRHVGGPYSPKPGERNVGVHNAGTIEHELRVGVIKI
jgi:hypothetical protein